MIISVSWIPLSITPLLPSMISKKMMSGHENIEVDGSCLLLGGQLFSSILFYMLLFITNTDGFVIPSLGIEDTYQTKPDASEVETLKPPPPKAKIDENIYLGPHGAPPSQSKQQELNSSGRKQRFKHKLKEADKKVSRTGGENKLENLRELVGGGKVTENIAKGSSSDWLDPHCNESQFEKCPQ
ncbi:hypothetical protein NC651_003683 [Populus alba x Populus x berolinensis]|nr:hypothetical protein NC651_003683 [Populus alba x Populus x berolinensis]